MKNVISNARISIVCLLAVTTVACLELDPVASERMASGVTEPATLSSSDTLEPVSSSLIDSAIRRPSRLPTDRAQDGAPQGSRGAGTFSV